MTEEMTSHGLTLNRREKINATGIINTPNVVEKLNGPAVPLPKSIILNVKP